MEQYIELNIWPDGTPEANGLSGAEDTSLPGFIANVSSPALMVYPAENPSGKAIVMCPGGGLTKVAVGHEGHDMAEWFNQQGITFGILKYRMPNGHKDVLLNDIQQSLRIMRQHKEEWCFTSLGVMGASIGGYIAASASVFATADTRPDFQILFYPVISMEDSITHINSRKQILGEQPDKELIRAYSANLHITKDTPPAFITVAADDAAVSPKNSISYCQALLENKVPVSLHVYPEGGHSFAFRESFPYREELMGELRKWLLGKK